MSAHDPASTGRRATGRTSVDDAAAPSASIDTGPGRPEPASTDVAGPVPFAEWDTPAEEWSLPGACPVGARRTLLLETAARMLFPIVLVFSIYLLIVGHYGPGGGFAGGLTAGLAFVLRYIAGGGADGAEIGARIKVRPPVLVGLGMALAVLSALAPVAFGAPVLASAKATFVLPLVGQVDLVSSLVLDVGVYLLIVGVVLDLLRSLGSGIERDAREAGDEPEDPDHPVVRR